MTGLIKKDLISTVEELYHLQNCQLAMGEYYQQLAERIPSERMFWEEAICDEVNFARATGRLIALVTSNPQSYGPGKYRVAVLETFLSGIYEQAEQVRKGALTTPEMLKIAYDYEGSAIILRPYDIVESQDSTFREFRKRLTDDVAGHCDRIRQYVDQKLGVQNKSSQIKLQNMTRTKIEF